VIFEIVPQSKIDDAQRLFNRLTGNSLTPQQMGVLTRATIEELDTFEVFSILSVDLLGDVLLLKKKQDGVVQGVMNRMLNNPGLPGSVKEFVKLSQIAYAKAKAVGLSKVVD